MKKNFMKISELEKIRSTAERLKLNGRRLLDDTALCLRECNGIGAKWMGPLCKLLTWLFPLLLVASAIHDIRYLIGGGWQDREAADREFYKNCLILVDDAYTAWNPMRCLCRRAARHFYYVLRAGGFAAWNSNRKKRGNNDYS